MINTFYLAHTKNGHYQIRLVDTHMVMSSNSDKEEVLKNLYDIVVRYGNKINFNKALKKMSEKEKNSEETLRRRREEYEMFSLLYEVDVSVVVKDALKFAQENTLLKKSREKIKTIPIIKKEKAAVEEKIIPSKVGEIKLKNLAKRKIGMIKL